MQAEDFVFAAAALASRCQNCAHHEHANRHRRSQMREAGEQTGRIESRDWKREEHSNLCTLEGVFRGKAGQRQKFWSAHLVRISFGKPNQMQQFWRVWDGMKEELLSS